VLCWVTAYDISCLNTTSLQRLKFRLLEMTLVVSHKCALLSTCGIYQGVYRCEVLEEDDKNKDGAILCVIKVN